MRRSSYYLRSDAIQRAVDRSHVNHVYVAEVLHISRSYWSQLLNRHRSLTPAVRTRLLRASMFRGMPEAELWDVFEKGG